MDGITSFELEHCEREINPTSITDYKNTEWRLYVSLSLYNDTFFFCIHKVQNGIKIFKQKVRHFFGWVYQMKRVTIF